MTGGLQLDSGIPMSKIDYDDEVFLAPEMNAFGGQFRFEKKYKLIDFYSIFFPKTFN